MISVCIYYLRCKIICKILRGFLTGGVPWNPPYALTDGRSTWLFKHVSSYEFSRRGWDDQVPGLSLSIKILLDPWVAKWKTG